eukprot:scaffold116002_cov60-Phaeocystis_antarctica.AAC.1
MMPGTSINPGTSIMPDNQCPAGADLTEAECDDYRTAQPGSTGGGRLSNYPSWPRGCFYYTSGGSVYFNTHASGDTNSNARPICNNAGCAAGTAPSPPPPSPPPPSPPPQQQQHWRVSNAGATTWRPAVNLAFFSDLACTASIAIPADGGWPDAASACPRTGCALCSGWDAVYGTVATKGCHLAYDDNPSTAWRPGTVSSGTGIHFPAGEMWMEIRFASNPGIACVKASNMGESGGGGSSWNGGLTVQTSVDGVTYVTRERDEGAASTYNLDANYFPALPPPPPCLASCMRDGVQWTPYSYSGSSCSGGPGVPYASCNGDYCCKNACGE